MEQNVSGVNRVLAGAMKADKAKAASVKIAPPAMSRPELFDAVRRMGERAKVLDVSSIAAAMKATGEKTHVQYRRIMQRRLLNTGDALTCRGSRGPHGIQRGPHSGQASR